MLLKLIRRVFLRGEYPAAPLLFVGRSKWWSAPVLTTMRWVSPDGRLSARLDVPRDMPGDDAIWIHIEGDAERVESLTLRPIWLGRVWGYVHHNGAAVVDLYTLQRRLRPHQPLTLEVGEARERWQPID